ncbi:MAG: D-alanyl-D-alanine carboxypeptidase [Clostridia bacterium]|nr:D-alanyl-D-alanine carboxypeptidase [Clostridia bacterium]
MASAYTLPPDVEVFAKSVYMVNLETGMVVYQKDPNAILYPASVVKLMTALVAVEQCPNIKTGFAVYPQVVEDLQNAKTDTFGLVAGEQVTLEQMLNLMLVPSFCDASNAIAVQIGGSIDGFVKLMNEKAAALGMKNTRYTNAHGLHDAKQVTTAYDQYLLAREIIKHKELVEICGQSSYTMPATNHHKEEQSFTTTNFMVNPFSDWFYKRVQGLKPGFSEEAGRNMVSLAEKDGQRYITVVLGSPIEKVNGYHQHKEFDTTYNLLYWAYTELEYLTIADVNQPVTELGVSWCKETDHVIVVPAEDFQAIVPKDAADSTILTPTLKKDRLLAPVKKGKVLGTATITCAGQEIGTVDLVAKNTCKLSFAMLIWSIVSHPICLVLYGIIAVAAIAFLVWNVRVNYRRRRLWNSRSRRR